MTLNHTVRRALNIRAQATARWAVISVLGCLVFATANARVESIHLEKIISNGTQKFNQVAIKCAGKLKKQRMLRSSTPGSKWCAEHNPTQCSMQKYDLARALCDSRSVKKTVHAKSKSKSASPKPDNSSTKPTALAEQSPNSELLASDLKEAERKSKFEDLINQQLLIEEQRILIEQRRLELSRQEIDLKRQRAMLER